tara:strand:+ start:1403 stop:1819 length:417 start_codon:yes stop_codon:yes gene_type:complete
MDYEKSLRDIMKRKETILKRYRQEYINYGTYNGLSEFKSSITTSLGNLNGLNNEIVSLKKTVLNECLNKNNNIEKSLTNTDTIMKETSILNMKLNDLQNKSETAEGSVEESQFFYKQDLANVIGKIVCIGIIIYALRR